MLIYSNSHYVADNGNGYELDTRYALCNKCGVTIGEQHNYRRISKDFEFDNGNIKDYKYCPYCGEKFLGTRN